MNELTSKFDKFFEFENNDKLLDFTLEYRNIPIWPLVRNQVIIHGILPEDYLNKHTMDIKGKSVKYIKKMTVRNPFFSTHKDIVYVGFPCDNFCSYENGKVYDERVKAYVDLFRSSCMIVSGTNFDETECGYKNWKLDYALIEFSQNRKCKSEKDALVLKKFMKFLEAECPAKISSALKNIIFNVISSYSLYLQNYVEAWKIYLQIVKPRLVVEYCGCFMGLSTVAMNIACADKKIPTADIQVCYIGKNMHSYNCGSAITQSKICKIMYPDYVLTWGRYYQNVINSPCQFVTIGTHRRYKFVKERNKNVLICLTDKYEDYLEHMDYIMNQIDRDAKVYLRLHPKYNTANNRNLYRKYEKDNRFFFANDKELEYYLNKCTYVFCTSSTVIFESLACGKIVLTPRDDYYEFYNLENIEDRIHVFDTVEQFEELWEMRESIPMKVYNDFFDMNYKKLFKKFVKEVTNGK